jgi:hypothetical protein
MQKQRWDDEIMPWADDFQAGTAPGKALPGNKFWIDISIPNILVYVTQL